MLSENGRGKKKNNTSTVIFGLKTYLLGARRT